MRKKAKLQQLTVRLTADRVELLKRLAIIDPPTTINCKSGQSAIARRLLENALDSLQIENPSKVA